MAVDSSGHEREEGTAERPNEHDRDPPVTRDSQDFNIGEAIRAIVTRYRETFERLGR